MRERQPLNASRVARQRLECASLLALLLAAPPVPGRLGWRSWTKAATSRRSPNAVAPAKLPAACLCLVFGARCTHTEPELRTARAGSTPALPPRGGESAPF